MGLLDRGPCAGGLNGRLHLGWCRLFRKAPLFLFLWVANVMSCFSRVRKTGTCLPKMIFDDDEKNLGGEESRLSGEACSASDRARCVGEVKLRE